MLETIIGIIILIIGGVWVIKPRIYIHLLNISATRKMFGVREDVTNKAIPFIRIAGVVIIILGLLILF